MALTSFDSGVYRVVGLHLVSQGEPWPFARWEGGSVIPDQLCFEHRAVSDELAGAQYRHRLPEAPPTVLGWLFRRGNDNFLAAYAPVGQLSQLVEISTSSKRLRIVDSFGNEQSAEPVEGKLRVLITNAAVYVHGLGTDDRFAFLPHLENERPRIIDPGEAVAAAGTPFRLRLDGRDPDASWAAKSLPSWTLVKAPEGMSIRPGSGVIEWLPKSPGRTQVVVRLTDSDGAFDERTFAATVKPGGTPLPPEFVSRPSPVAVKNGSYRYRPLAADPYGEPVKYEFDGPPDSKIEAGAITWRPTQAGGYPVTVKAVSSKGAAAIQRFDLTVSANPDRPAEGLLPPRAPTDLTVTHSGADGITVVWNPHSFAEHVVQRAPGPAGPWNDLAVAKENSHMDRPLSGRAYYRVVSRNEGGSSDPTAVVNGRNRGPIADAGPSVKLDGPGSVNLDASRSSDPEGRPLRYQWSLVAADRGSHPKLDRASSPRPTLTLDKPGRYVAILRVTDGEETSAPDYVWVVAGVDPLERVAYAGPDRFAAVGETVPLKPVASSPAQKAGRFFWRWDTSPLDGYVGIQDSGKEAASLTPDTPGVYSINLWSLDDRTYGYPDTLRVIVAPRR
jgi:hypothetical protein